MSERPTMPVNWVATENHTTTPECIQGCVADILTKDQHDPACQWSDGPHLGTAWCPRCRRRVEVADQFNASQMQAHGEVEYQVTALTCGHEVQGDPHVVAAAPGAPYAGPGVATADSTRPRDLRATGRRQAQIDRDPWETQW